MKLIFMIIVNFSLILTQLNSSQANPSLFNQKILTDNEHDPYFFFSALQEKIDFYVKRINQLGSQIFDRREVENNENRTLNKRSLFPTKSDYSDSLSSNYPKNQTNLTNLNELNNNNLRKSFTNDQVRRSTRFNSLLSNSQPNLFTQPNSFTQPNNLNSYPIRPTINRPINSFQLAELIRLNKSKLMEPSYFSAIFNSELLDLIPLNSNLNPNNFNSNGFNPIGLNSNGYNPNNYNSNLDPNYAIQNLLNPNAFNSYRLDPNLLNPNAFNLNRLHPNLLNSNGFNPNTLNRNILNPNNPNANNALQPSANEFNSNKYSNTNRLTPFRDSPQLY